MKLDAERKSTMNNKLLTLTLTLTLAAQSAFGIGATQEWVRRLVASSIASSATNFTARGEIPASMFSDGDTNSTYTVEISAGIGSHPALKVVSSTVPAIPAGTFYARAADGSFVNCSNSLITAIYTAPYTATEIVTNAIGGICTNSVKMWNFWASDSTNGVWRMTFDGDTILYNSGDRSASFAIRSTTLPERAASVLIPSQTARLSIRDLLSLAIPSVCAATVEETVYTIQSEATIVVNTITITRINKKTGKSYEVIFTPRGMEAVYSGPNEFNTREEANAAASDLLNWGFKVDGSYDWTMAWNEDGFGQMSIADLMNSDIWRQLVSQIGEKRVTREVETPKPQSHPCPCPENIYIETAYGYVTNSIYTLPDGGWDVDALDEWRGQNECKCEFGGCSKQGISSHLEGRVKSVGGSHTFSTDVDGGDGCKCCIRCVKYGSDAYKTIDEYNDHRASGEGAGFCGCACEKYDAENESEWPQDFHNLPSHTLAWPNLDYSCMCYCAKAKALNGEYVRHSKYAGDSPWCEKICARCGMVEDKEQYISHSYPAFDTRHVTLREAAWDDHTPRAEAGPGVSLLNDATYYDRCGCACGAYDTASGGVLPGAFGKFHQFHNSAGTCLCTCGQIHSKDSLGDGNGTHTPSPCPKICSVCGLVEDNTTEQTITIGDETYPKLVMRQPTEFSDHEPNDTECGCKCGYITPTDSAETDEETKAFHIARDEDFACLCECNRFHEGKWETATCGAYSWRQCTLFEDHVYEGDSEQHEYANGHPDDSVHFCKCAKKKTASHVRVAGTATHEPGWIITPYSCSVSGCGWSKTERTACTHTWGNYVKISDFVGGSFWRKTCSVCGATEDMIVSYADSQTCNTNINLHIPLEDDCGCKCGKYGSDAETADEKDFHKWDDTDTEDGVANCHCKCGSKHEWRSGCVCPNVCAFCKDVKKDGMAANEADHIAATDHRCGCKCGYYGVTSQHASDGRSAISPHLHNQATFYGNGTSSTPAYCQCYGALNSSGGLHHYSDPKSTCANICKWKVNGETFGHLAAKAPDGQETTILKADPSHHTHKTYGCGCACGDCNMSNIAQWRDVRALHRLPANAVEIGDLCHCACTNRFIGDTYINGEFHTFYENDCTCTCGKMHKDQYCGACNKCSVCGMYQTAKKGFNYAATLVGTLTRDSHHFSTNNCYCAEGRYGGGVVPYDGHFYETNSCTCQCGEERLDYDAESEESSSEFLDWKYCVYCGEWFFKYRITVRCSRCKGTTTGHGPEYKTLWTGAHKAGCSKPNLIQTGCWRCGCTIGSGHVRCSGHFCRACCSNTPKINPKRPRQGQTPTQCNHDHQNTRSSTRSTTCQICHEEFTVETTWLICMDCKKVLSCSTSESGNHGSHSGSSSGSSESGEGEQTGSNECPLCGASAGAHLPGCPRLEGDGQGGESGGTGGVSDI